MTVSLRPMHPDEIPAFIALTCAERVDDMVATGTATREGATQATETATKELFPDGTAGDNALFTAVDDGRPVGCLWMRPVEDAPVPTWSVWWVYVEPHARRRGIGRRIMLLAEDEVTAHGGVEMRLNVYAHNPNARALYEQIGYRPTATQMRKVL